MCFLLPINFLLLLIKRWKFVRLSLLPQPSPFLNIENSKSEEAKTLQAIQINVQQPTPATSQSFTPPEEKTPEPDYTSTHLRAVDNDECAKKKYTSRKLKAKRVMQAVVVSI